MRRITILLGVLAALMLVPTASAFAENQATLTIGGSGSGEVSSAEGLHALEPAYEPGLFVGEPAIECSYASPGPESGTCANEMEDIEAGFLGTMLFATPVPGSEFAGWTTSGGREAGKGIFASCYESRGEVSGGNQQRKWQSCFAYTLGSADVAVTAAFEPCAEGSQEPSCVAGLTVEKTGTGKGSVTSEPAGIECGETCYYGFGEGEEVTLEASPAEYSTFTGWTGCTSESEGKCQVTLGELATSSSVEANFVQNEQPLTLNINEGEGTVVSSPAGITCVGSEGEYLRSRIRRRSRSNPDRLPGGRLPHLQLAELPLGQQRNPPVHGDDVGSQRSRHQVQEGLEPEPLQERHGRRHDQEHEQRVDLRDHLL